MRAAASPVSPSPAAEILASASQLRHEFNGQKLSLLCLAGAWKAFVTGKYRRKRYYFNHLEFLVQVSVLSLNQFAPITVGRCVTLSLVLLALLVLFVKLRPFTKELRCVEPLSISVSPWNQVTGGYTPNGSCANKRWMFYQRVGSLFCAILAQFVNIARIVESGVHRLCGK